jgi:crotonobetainyl-CoA hydratase/dehydration protein DpgD
VTAIVGAYCFAFVNLEFSTCEQRGHVWYVTINRPEVMNALHREGSLELARLWDEFAADDDAWVAVVTGAGDRAFSTGYDLKSAAARDGKDSAEPAFPELTMGFAGLTNRFDLYKPVIARVNGYALGGGMELALACDIVVAADHVRFGLPEVKVGLTAAAGGTFRLPRQIPLKIAMGHLLTGRHLTAQRAYDLGLVNELTTLDDLDSAVQRWVDEILAAAPLSIRATKQMVLDSQGLSVADAFARNYVWDDRRRTSDDAAEGPRAFAEKRPPRWTGR